MIFNVAPPPSSTWAATFFLEFRPSAVHRRNVRPWVECGLGSAESRPTEQELGGDVRNPLAFSSRAAVAWITLCEDW